MHSIRQLLHTLFAVLLLLVPYSTASAEKNTAISEPLKIIGWVEFIRLEPWGIKTPARIDTGANTSSMSARDISVFKKNGKTWVRFTFDFRKDTGGRSVEIERPLVRMLKIKQHDGPPQERPVISMEICLADEIREAEFDLIDRRALNYPVLLGRKALAGYVVVDPARAYLSRAVCGHTKKKKKENESTDSGRSE
ncbi:ATP-dependent zinc protease [Nitrosomonas sp.]|uniref:ATP-dependent zinc protease family protein n=1 Tax=Nitrosomonas sp. TaxID=42353 RepID=UPI0025D0FA9F|nr:ATP-dependent zinc protease [Nitrosomonas sp.]MCC6917311.1 ATP-dependent zinc protease [Nitrosomonas sp.]